MREKWKKLVELHGTPLFILDHKKIGKNYRIFKKRLPRVQCYYAVKANPNPEIVKTLFEEGSSFDVASYNEFMQVYEYLRDFEEETKIFLSGTKLFSPTPSRTGRPCRR
jgi:ornithine decarboxylase